MTTPSLLHQRQDPQWAVACIKGLEGEIKKLETDWTEAIDCIGGLEDELEQLEARIEAAVKFCNVWRKNQTGACDYFGAPHTNKGIPLVDKLISIL